MHTVNNLPVVCTLSPQALAARRQDLLPGLARRAEAREATADGLRLRFSATTEMLSAVFATVDAERQCCRFLNFAITVAPDGGPLWLTMSGPPGTQAFLAGLLDG